jgi:trimeric autotransporter adhesin
VRHLKRHLSVANVLSCMALFVALSASAFAATTLTKKSVKAQHIANGAVTTPKLRNAAVTAAKIRNGAVIGSKLAPGAIGATQLADGSVRSSKLGGGVVTEAKIKNGAVSANKLGEGAVSSGKLASSFLAQLVRNVTYVNAESASNEEIAKSATASCPAGKQAIGGGARVSGELKDVAVTGSNPFVSGASRTGWSAFARDVDGVGAGNWAVEAFAICAEL